MNEWSKDFESVHQAQVKIRELQSKIQQGEKEKEELQTQVDYSQQAIKQLEAQVHVNLNDKTGSPRNPPVEEEELALKTKKIAELQELLDSTIKAAQDLEVQLTAMTKEKEALEAENKELQEKLEDSESESEGLSPTASGGKLSKKMMSEFVNAKAADKIRDHIKYYLGRGCKFAHTKDRFDDLAHHVWEHAKEKCEVKEKTKEAFVSVYEPVIMEGLTKHRQYIQSRTQDAAACESTAWPSFWVIFFVLA